MGGTFSSGDDREALRPFPERTRGGEGDRSSLP